MIDMHGNVFVNTAERTTGPLRAVVNRAWFPWNGTRVANELAIRFRGSYEQMKMDVERGRLTIQEDKVPFSAPVAGALYDAGVRSFELSRINSGEELFTAMRVLYTHNLKASERILGDMNINIRYEGMPVRWKDFYAERNPFKPVKPLQYGPHLFGCLGLFLGAAVGPFIIHPWYRGLLEGAGTGLAGPILAIFAGTEIVNAFNYVKWLCAGHFRSDQAVVNEYELLKDYTEGKTSAICAQVAGILMDLRSPSMISDYLSAVPEDGIEDLAERIFRSADVNQRNPKRLSIVGRERDIRNAEKVIGASRRLQTMIAADPRIAPDHKTDLALRGVLNYPGIEIDVPEVGMMDVNAIRQLFGGIKNDDEEDFPFNFEKAADNLNECGEKFPELRDKMIEELRKGRVFGNPLPILGGFGERHEETLQALFDAKFLERSFLIGYVIGERFDNNFENFDLELDPPLTETQLREVFDSLCKSQELGRKHWDGIQPYLRPD